MFSQLNKKNVQLTDIHAPTLSLISTWHIYEVLCVPAAYHSQVVDKIITNESGELLTVKETKELVDDIREKIANLHLKPFFRFMFLHLFQRTTVTDRHQAF